MRIGIGIGDISGPSTIDGVVAQATAAAADGFGAVWAPQISGLDALTALAVAGREVPDIELGTSVVPTFPRHPIALALQALSCAQATGGRITLGIGLSHQLVIENMYGLSFDQPVRHMTEYLEILLPLLETGRSEFRGDTLTGAIELTLPHRPAVPVLVAALGPKMLELAGRNGVGTITWMTGPKTLAGHVVPSITAAASEAGHGAPRVVAGFPIGVSDEPDEVRRLAAKVLSIYGMLPSYRAMLDREGVEGPADIVITGDEDAVTARLDELAAAGVTDLWAVEFGKRDADRQRTRELLKARLG